ncbi:MAG: WD40 repeat domain-containing protein [Actinobacteria bacterium]|nr:WD40 repeat domain-containing protein [Actinomycetota bacterium]
MPDSPAPVATFPNDDRVSSIAFSHDGRRVAAIADKKVRVYTLNSAVPPIDMTTDVELFSVRFAPTGVTAAVSGSAPGLHGVKSLIVFDPANGVQRWRSDSAQFVEFDFAPDALAMLAYDGKSARLLEAASGAQRWTFDMPQGQKLYRTAFSPDGTTVALATGMSRDSGEIILLDAASGAVRRRVPVAGQVRTVGFSRTGRFLAFGPDIGIGVLDTTTGTFRLLPNPTVPHHGNLREVFASTFSDDDRLIGAVSVTINGINPTITVLDSDTLATRHELPDGFFGLFEFARGSRSVLTAETGATVRVWDVDSGADLFAFTPAGEFADIGDATLDPTGRLVAVASGSIVSIFELPVTERLRLIHGGAVTAVAFDPTGTRLITGSADTTARLFTLPAGTENTRITHNDTVTTVTWIPNQSWFATASTDRTARIIDTTTGTQRARIDHNGPVTTLTTNTDGTRLATGTTDGTARIIDTTTGTTLRRLTLDDAVLTVAFNPTTTRLAVGSADGTARIYNTATGAEILNLAHNGAVNTVTFSPDGTHLATASTDTTARIYDTTTGTLLATLPHNGPVTALTYSPDGTRLATGATDNTARIYTTTGALLHTLPHPNPVTALIFTPDATRLATASTDGNARIYDTTTAAELRTLPHDGPLTTLTINPAGTQLATASTDKTARLYDIPAV